MVNVFPHNHWSATACPGEIAGSQNAEYMTRAKKWYRAMTGGTEPAPPINLSRNRSLKPTVCTCATALALRQAAGCPR